MCSRILASESGRNEIIVLPKRQPQTEANIRTIYHTRIEDPSFKSSIVNTADCIPSFLRNELCKMRIEKQASVKKKNFSKTKSESRLDSFSQMLFFTASNTPATKLPSSNQISPFFSVDWSLLSQVKPDCVVKPKASYRAEINRPF